jgi:katanin p60 ATPase-containing subunit A1
VLPLVLPHFFTGLLKPWKGVLLHGPPGTGKTLLARALASTTQTTFFNVSASLLVSKWRGQSEKLVRVLFRMARHCAPSLVFLDEIDCLTRARGGEHEASRRLKSSLFSEIDGITSGGSMGGGSVLAEGARPPGLVLVLGTSNRPWDVDEAMRRRLEKRIHIGLPDAEAREQLLRHHLASVKVADDVDYAGLASSTEGFSGHDVQLLCRDASMAPLRGLVRGQSAEAIRALRDSPLLAAPVTQVDLLDSLTRSLPRVCKYANTRKYTHEVTQSYNHAQKLHTQHLHRHQQRAAVSARRLGEGARAVAA